MKSSCRFSKIALGSCSYFALLAASVGQITPAQAADATWSGITPDWFSSANWSTGVVPGATTSLTISGSTATIATGGANSSNATIDAGGEVDVSGAGTVWNNDGSSLGFGQRGGAIVVGASGTGTLLIENGATVETTGTPAGTVLIGNLSGSTGTVTVGNGTGNSTLVNAGPSGFPGNFYVGYEGNGTLNVNAGGSVSGFDGMTLGVATGGTGHVNLNGGSLDVSALHGGLTVGNQGQGTVSVTNGGQLTSYFGFIGSGTGSAGSSATVDGSGSVWNVTGTGLKIGMGGDGALNIQNGGIVDFDSPAAQQLYVSAGNGTGTLTIDGGELNAEGVQTFIGANGTGSANLTVENGGVLKTSLAYVGGSSLGTTGNATVLISGSGSLWDATLNASHVSVPSSTLVIGNPTGGTAVAVRSGGTLTSGFTEIGNDGQPGFSTNLTVDGAGSSWVSPYEDIIGYEGSYAVGQTAASAGSVTISGGATASSATMIVGRITDSATPSLTNDQLTVTGAGSKLTVAPANTFTGALDIGYLGSGQMTVSNGATVNSDHAIIGYSSAAAGLWSTNASAMNSFGVATVTGAGSNWSIDNALIVGDNVSGTTNGRLGSFAIGTGTSQGSLTIDGGASVTDASAIVGANAGATGSVTVTGTGSEWTTTGNVELGLGGSGSLAVLNGATVSASDTQIYAQGALTIGTGSINSDVDGGAAGVGGLLTTDGTGIVFGNVGASAPLNLVGVTALTGHSSLTIDGSLAATTTSIAQNGTLTIGTGGAVRTVTSDINDDGALIINHSDDVTLDGSISGAGSVNLQGPGTFTINGSSNPLSGLTTVAAGTLIVGDDAHHDASIGGSVSVADGATLAGHGSVGATEVEGGGTLAPGASVGTLSVNGNLTMDQGSKLDFEFDTPGTPLTPGVSDSVHVAGDLALQGTTLNVIDAGHMGPGVYRLFDYTGGLSQTNGGILSPAGDDIEYLTADKQINLINAAGQTLNFWNANGLASTSERGGGDGTWSNTSITWTDATGSLTSAMNPQPGFGIFGGEAGSVSVDDSAGDVAATGLQFASDGYRLFGDRLTLAADSGHPAPVAIEVGDGSAGSASWTATINNEIAGTDGLKKTGLGTLVLAGANTYSGGTEIDAGTISASSDANLGAASGGLTFNGGVLQVTGTSFTSTPRNIVWGAGGGGFDIASAFNTFAVSQPLAGSGSLLKLGAGTLTLSGASSYSGGTTIQKGTVAAATTGALGSGPVNVGTGSTLKFLTGTNAGTLSLTTASSTGTGVNGGFIQFANGSSADHAQILNGTLGAIEFRGGATGAAAQITNAGGDVSFWDSSNAQQANILNRAGGSTNFLDSASAGQATISNAADGVIDFFDTSTAANAVIENDGGVVQFRNSTSAGSSTVTSSNAGRVLFRDNSDAAGATIINDGDASVDISRATTGVAIGSLSGSGNVLLGSKTLTLGGLGRDDTIDGIVEDGGAGGGTGGSLVKSGAATLTLNGVNTYTGTTTVEDGRLVVGDDTHPNASIAGSLSVADGGTLGGAGTFGGNVAIADGGTLAPGNSPGTLTIHGNLTLSSGSKLSFEFGQANVAGGPMNDLVDVSGDLVLDGTLTTSVSPGGSFGPGIYRVFGYGGTLTDNGLDLAGAAAGSGISVQTSVDNQVNLVSTAGLALNYWDGGAGPKFDGHIDGGSGSWQATGGNNWTDEAGKSNGAYTNGSFDIFAGSAGAVSVDDSLGDVTVSGMQFASDGYAIAGDAIGLTGTQATIRVGDGTAAGANYVATISSELTGTAGLAKDDRGTLVLNGNNSYTGATDILAGTLAVNGSIASSAVAVHDGATLAGNGTVGATAVQSGGIVEPGNSIGTLHLNGRYSQASGSVYQAEVDPTSSASDRIAVSGTANLSDGAVINVTKTADAPYVAGSKYTVLTTTGGLTGTFDLTGATDLSAFLGLVDTYDADNAYLAVAQTRSIASAGRTSNQKAVGGGLDSLSQASALMTPILNLPSADGVPQILDQLSGEIHSSAQTALMDDSQFARDAAAERLREAFCGIGTSAAVKNDAARDGASASKLQTDCGNTSDHATSWTRAIGSWGRTDGNGNAATLDRTIGGFFAGVDLPVADSWRVGALAGYTRSNFDVDARNSSGSSDDYHVGLYGGTQAGALGVRAGAIYTWHDISTRRSLAFSGFSDSLNADYHAGTTQVFGDLGYRIDAGAAAFEPFANLAYVNLHTDGFDERGGEAALSGQSSSTDTTFTTVGVRGSTALALGSVDLSANGSIGWRHAIGDVTPTSSVAFAGGNPFTIAGTPVAKDAAVAEVGLDMRVTPNTTLGVSYNGQFGSHANDQGVRGTLQVKF